MHHVFTNSKLYDDDIKHDYKIYLYEFLYLKWRFDSLVSAITKLNYVKIYFIQMEIAGIAINYMIIFYNYENLVYFLVGNLLGGLYSAFVLVGNHEREVRYDEKIKHSFVDHQIVTCRNYEHTNFFWLILMGGMQFQAEHHLFPQIPFYRLPDAVPIIKEELAKIGKTIAYGPVL
jgi:fatty acid desaturase